MLQEFDYLKLSTQPLLLFFKLSNLAFRKKGGDKKKKGKEFVTLNMVAV
jgi:hypothetical protein